MSLHAWITAVACAGELGLMLLVALRGTRNTLTAPYALLMGVLFAWNFSSLSYELTHEAAWRYTDFAISPQVGPAALLFGLTYLGRRRQLRALLIAFCGAFSILSLAALLQWAGYPLIPLTTWTAIDGTLILAVTAVGLVLLASHMRQTVIEAERVRTRVLMLGMVILPALGITELGSALWANVPRLGSLGTLISSALLARVALGLDLLGKRRSITLAYGGFLGLVGLLAYLSVWEAFAPGEGAAAFVLGTIALVLIAVGRQIASALSERMARIAQFTMLGRFSAQMAHDIKNPLAALKGAAQFLQQERARGKDLNASFEMIDLMVEQIDRIQRVIDSYQRLGKVEAIQRATRLDALAKAVCALQSLAPPPGITVRQEFAAGLPECLVDPDLVSAALENLVRNALQAMPRGGTLTIRTEAGDAGGNVAILVQDTGVGMNPRTRERAFDPFFTTKEGGSGMGLAFVRRVVEAHGGRLALTSREGQGTTVRLEFPPVQASQAA
jgi:signal transduction histidine kinase